MKVRWTNGPWRLGNDALHGKELTVWAAEPGICITSVFDGSMGPDAPPMREAIANARLIAAAPELYSALKTVLRIGPRPWIPGKPRVSFEEWDAAIEAAERALSRAADQWPEVNHKPDPSPEAQR